MDENIEKLYQALLTKGYSESYLGGYDVFAKNITNPEKNRSFYDKVVSENKITAQELGGYDVFASKTIGKVKKKGGLAGFLQDGAFWGKVAEMVGLKGQPDDKSTPVVEDTQEGDTPPIASIEESLSLFEAPDLSSVSYGEDPLSSREEIDDATAQRMINNAPKSTLSLIKKDINDYYDKQGWKTPEQKFDEYNAGVERLMSLYDGGKISAEQAEENRQTLLNDLNLVSKGGKVSVPRTEMDMFKDVFEDSSTKRINESKEKTKDSFLKDVYDEITVGAARTLKTPWAVMATAERVSNGVLSLYGLIDRKDRTYWQEKEKLENGWIEDMAALNERYDQNITDAVAEGNMAQAAGQTVIKAAGAIPQMLPIIMGNAMGATKAGIAYMGTDKALNKYLRNAEDPEMSEAVRWMNAFSHGLAEAAFLNIGTVPILKNAQAAMRVTGKETIQKEAKEMLKPYLEREFARAWKGMGAGAREGVEEVATGLSEDVADWAAGEPVEIGSHVLDDFMVGFAMGQGMSSAATLNKKGGPREYAKSMRKAVPKDLPSESQADLYMTFIEGDQIRMDMENAPESSKAILKERLQVLEERAKNILKDSDDPRYSHLTGKYDDLSKTDDILKEEATEEAAEKVPEKPVEPLKSESEGEAPLDGESAKTQAKSKEKPTEDTPTTPKQSVELVRDTKTESIRGEGHVVYRVKDTEGKQVGLVTMNKLDDFGGYVIENALMDEPGQGIGTETYKQIAKELDAPIVSDAPRNQTEAAKGLWAKLEREGVAEKFTNKVGEERYRTIKPKQDATKEPSTTEVPVEAQPEVSTEVREGDAEVTTQEPATKETGLVPKGIKAPSPPPPTGDGSKKLTGAPVPPKKADGLSWMRRVNKQEKAALEKEKKRPRPTVLDKIGEAVFNTERFVQRTLKKLGTEEAVRAQMDINLRHGSSASTAMRVERARSRIFGDALLPGRSALLGGKQQKLLGKSVMAMRVLELESNRQRKRDFVVTQMIQEKLGEKQAVKEEVAENIRKMVDESVTMEEVMQRLNEYMPDALAEAELTEIWDAAWKEYPKIKHTADGTMEDALDFLQRIENKDEATLAEFGLKPDQVDVDMLRQRAEEYYAALRENLVRMRDAGIISQELYDKLLTEYPYYSPRMYMEHVNMIDGDGGVSGLKGITTGSEGAMITNLDALLTDAVMRTESMVFNNRMLNSLAEVARTSPDNGIVMQPTVKEGQTEQTALPTAEKGLAIDDPKLRDAMTKNLDEVYEKPPAHMVAVDYFENGVRKRLWVDKYIHDAIYAGDKMEWLSKAMQIAGWTVGTPILRAAATGYNPEFAVKNIVLDATHQYFSTTEWSMWAPKAIAQMKSSMEAVMEDAVMRKGRYLDLIMEGGGMNFLSDQGKFSPARLEKGYSNMAAGVKEAGDVMGYIGNTSEVLMRLAIRERSISNQTNKFIENNGRSPNKEELKEIQRAATASARSYVDFNQGGYTAKALNHLIPYLNAGLQVGRVTAQAIAKDKIKWGVKVLQIAAISYAAAKWNMGDYEGGDDEEKAKMREAYLNDVSPQVRGANMVIMTPLKYTDGRGFERYMYIKIPIQPFVHNIKLFTEDMTIKHSLGGAYKDYKLMNNEQFEGLKATFRNFGDLSSAPPLTRALMGYQSNYDNFYDSPIWSGAEYAKDKSQEYYEGYTPERFVEIGKKSSELTGGEYGLSPVRLHYAAKQVFTGSNLFVSAMGYGADQLALKIDPELKERQHKEVALELTNTPFVRRFVSTTNPYAKDRSEDILGQRNKMKTINNRKLRDILDSDLPENDKDMAVDGLIEVVLENDFAEAKRLYNYYHTLITGQDISGNIYSSLMVINDVPARAEVYHEKTKNLPDDQRAHMDEVSSDIIGLWSETFIQRLYELREQDGIE